MEATGCRFPDVHFDAEQMAALAAAGHTRIGFDTIMPVFSAYTEVAALGAEMVWGDETRFPIATGTLWHEPGEVELPADFLRRPPVAVVLEALGLLRRRHGPQVAILGKVMGPWTLATEGHGIEELLTETVTHPRRVRDFLERLCEIIVTFGRAQVAAGADALTLGEGGCGDVISPRTYVELLLPLHVRLVAALGCPVILHICGDSGPRIGAIAAHGFDCFHFDSKVDPRRAVELAGGAMSLAGNIDTADTLCHGSPEQVRQLVRYALEAGVGLIAPGCTTAPTTPDRNLRAIVEEIRALRGIAAPDPARGSAVGGA